MAEPNLAGICRLNSPIQYYFTARQGAPSEPDKIPKPQNVASGPARRFVPSCRSARSAQIGLALRKRGQLLVGCLFLIERLLQNAGAIVASELFRPERSDCRSAPSRSARRPARH